GRYGFVVAGDGVPLQLYELDRTGRLVDAAEEAGIDVAAQARALGVVPLLSNRPDLYVVASGAPNLLFRNLGDGTFEEVGASLQVSDGLQHGCAVAVLDADGDGLFDLVIGNRPGANRLFLNRALGFFENAPPELAQPSRVGTVVAADFDNDGNEELFFANMGERNRLFAWRAGRWTEMDIGDAAEPRGMSSAAAVADVDGDGRLELLVAHGAGAPHPLAFFHALPNANAWLRVLPMTPYGAPARGAMVSCVAAGRTQRRVLCCGQGAACQMEPVAHFGLSEVTSVDRVEVVWPDGMVAVIERPPVGRLLPVPYPPL
ncbi:MAG TPA: CRTAC1 family protein, partial [Azospirillaceae bacterium]|nr:CRTAC1 family protein [Azospirillaceae bacterium]